MENWVSGTVWSCAAALALFPSFPLILRLSCWALEVDTHLMPAIMKESQFHYSTNQSPRIKSYHFYTFGQTGKNYSQRPALWFRNYNIRNSGNLVPWFFCVIQVDCGFFSSLNCLWDLFLAVARRQSIERERLWSPNFCWRDFTLMCSFQVERSFY